MREVHRIAPDEILPDVSEVLGQTGVAPRSEPSAGVAKLVTRAIELLRKHARPVGLVEEISREEFAAVYAGEGRNQAPGPVEDVFRRAERLGLHAATLGREVQDEIGALFETGDFPLGYLLDAAASAAAENTARALCERFLHSLAGRATVARDHRALDYSPGYCGWHLTGQRRLFERLNPGEIGILLNESCLMHPLKSVSGVILVGPAGIHRLETAYPCCTTCSDRDCRERSAHPVELPAS